MQHASKPTESGSSRIDYLCVGANVRFIALLVGWNCLPPPTKLGDVLLAMLYKEGSHAGPAIIADVHSARGMRSQPSDQLWETFVCHCSSLPRPLPATMFALSLVSPWPESFAVLAMLKVLGRGGLRLGARGLCRPLALPPT